jgi:TRAP-type C4-dicarboxylate transport system permease small subunit
MQPTFKSQSRFQPFAAAILFAVSFMVAVFAVTTPHFNAADATWLAFWNNRSHRITEIVAVYASLVAGGALIWFAAQLAKRVANQVIYAAGWASAVMLWVSRAVLGHTGRDVDLRLTAA